MKFLGSLLTVCVFAPVSLIVWFASAVDGGSRPDSAHAIRSTRIDAARPSRPRDATAPASPTPMLPAPQPRPASSPASWPRVAAAEPPAFEPVVLFEIPGFYMVGEAVAVADITGDRRDDIVVLAKPSYNAPSTNRDTFHVFRQTADGGFLPPLQIVAGSTGYNRFALGDLDGDGDAEIVIATEGGMVTWTYRADGTFAYNYSYGISKPNALALMDVDRDGRLDAVTRNIYSGGAIYYGDGLGGFRNEQQTHAIPSGHAFSVGDVTSDGLADVVAADESQYLMTVLPHAEITASVGSGMHYPYEPAPYGITPAAIGDFNADGRADIAFGVGAETGALVTLRHQDATRTFGPPTSFALPDYAQAVVSADLDGNGSHDLAVVYGSIPLKVATVRQGAAGLGALTPVAGLDDFPFAANQPLAVGRLDADGCRDMALLDTRKLVLLRRSNCFRAPPMAVCRTQMPAQTAASGLRPSLVSPAAGVRERLMPAHPGLPAPLSRHAGGALREE